MPKLVRRPHRTAILMNIDLMEDIHINLIASTLKPRFHHASFSCILPLKVARVGAIVLLVVDGGEHRAPILPLIRQIASRTRVAVYPSLSAHAMFVYLFIHGKKTIIDMYTSSSDGI